MYICMYVCMYVCMYLYQGVHLQKLGTNLQGQNTPKYHLLFSLYQHCKNENIIIYLEKIYEKQNIKFFMHKNFFVINGIIVLLKDKTAHIGLQL